MVRDPVSTPSIKSFQRLRRWPGLAVSGNRTIDQPWIERLQRGVVEFQSPHHPRAEILHDDVRSCHKPADRVDRIGRFQIEHEAFLAGIELAEHAAEAVAKRPAGSHRLASNQLDLDDLRSHVGKHPRTMRAGDRGRKIEDAEALEAPCRIPLIVSRYGHCRISFGLRSFGHSVTWIGLYRRESILPAVGLRTRWRHRADFLSNPKKNWNYSCMAQLALGARAFFESIVRHHRNG
jgi:hypothetical protein